MDLICIDPLPSYAWYQDGAVIAAGDFTAIARLACQAAQIAGVHRQAGS